ncbi:MULTISPECIES: hypothetical protein [Georgenia]|nr:MULTISPECIES: hypothetical protein [Georgenia]
MNNRRPRWWVWAVGVVLAVMVVVVVLLVVAVVTLGVPTGLLGDVGSVP